MLVVIRIAPAPGREFYFLSKELATLIRLCDRGRLLHERLEVEYVETGLGLVQGCPRRESADDAERVVILESHVWLKGQRQRQRTPFFDGFESVEIRRRDADDGARNILCGDLLADHSRIETEPALPVSIVDDCDGGFARL